jgi:5-methyltetrahydropteroyltriglutamate--homocysteine methyltransferase
MKGSDNLCLNVYTLRENVSYRLQVSSRGVSRAARRAAAMHRSTERILTTHTGSLPRPPSLQNLLYAAEQGKDVDQSTFQKEIQEAVNAVVHQQVSCGLDIINDGEMGKISYMTYPKDRLSGFRGPDAPARMQALDLVEFPDYAGRMLAAMPFLAHMHFPSCNGPITYTGVQQLARDLANLHAVTQQVHPTDAFMTAASPGIIAIALSNQHYSSYEAYLSAIAEAMKAEYDAIVQAGFLLQVDCPDLPMITGDVSVITGKKGDSIERVRAWHVEMLNYATRDISPEWMRMHVCWGHYEGPHHHDVPLRDLIGPILQARPATLVLEASNPRHEHEWQVFAEVKWPGDKQLVLGVLDTTTNFIEHPELVAQRLVRVARLLGREHILAGTNCGFSTAAGFHLVDPQIVWAKLQAMVQGAHLASQQLW